MGRPGDAGPSPGPAASSGRRALRLVLAHPATDALVATLILVSVGLILWEAGLPPDHPLTGRLELAGDMLVIVFVVELSLRWLVARSTGRFLREYALDVISVVPLFRSLRILRVLRILRLVRFGLVLNRRMQRFRTSLFGGAAEYLLLLIFVAMVLMTTTLGIHWVEGPGNPAFRNLDDAFWWSLHSLMAGEPVGGEPASPVGKGITALVMLGGMTVFAILTGLVTAHMTESLRSSMNDRSTDVDDLRNHIVIAGFNRATTVVVDQIHADPRYARVPLVLVSEGVRPEAFTEDHFRKDLLYFIQADYTHAEVLRRAGIERASMAILLADASVSRSDQDRDARTVLAAMTIERLCPGIFTCAQLLNAENASHLNLAGVEEVVVPDVYAGNIIAAAGRARGLVGLVNEVFSSHYGNHFFRSEIPASWIGRTYLEVLPEVKDLTGALLVSLEQAGGKQLVNPPGDYRIQEGDRALFIAREDPTGRLTKGVPR